MNSPECTLRQPVQRSAPMRCLTWAAMWVALAAAVPAISAPVDLAPVEHPARWIHQDYIVELNDMPRTYTCLELWYKFRDTLQAIGARTSEIIPYDCARMTDSPMRSPRVEVKFVLPDRLSKRQARWADFRTIERSVEIAPGALPSLSADDCQLVQRIKAGLIQPLGLHILKSHFQCFDPRPTYDLLLKADALPKGNTAPLS